MDSNNLKLKKCNFCGEQIPADTGRCPFCGSLLEVPVDEGAFRIPGERPPEDHTQSGAASGEAPADVPAAGEAPAADAGGARANAERTGYLPGNAEGYTKAYYNDNPGFRVYKKPPLSNGMKVFLTLVFALIPGIGQLAGIITAIVFMNTDDDPDRKSFGVAILVASLIMFVLACIGCFTAAVILSMSQSFGELPY